MTLLCSSLKTFKEALFLLKSETNGNLIKKCTHDAPNMITTWAIMIGRDRDFNHVEDIGRQYYVLKLVEFQTFENRYFH